MPKELDMSQGSIESAAAQAITEGDLGKLALKEGWGVLQRDRGIRFWPNILTLIDVFDDKGKAQEEAARLTKEEGFVHQRWPEDPTSDVLHQRMFEAAKVSLKELKPEVTVSAVYELTDPRYAE